MLSRDALAVAAFVAASGIGIVAVVLQAEKDSVDPARCGTLVAMGGRCCAPGQTLSGQRCAGRPERCPAPLEVSEQGCVAPRARVAVAGGLLHVGPGDWEADGRLEPHDASLGPFEMDAFEITEGAYADCAEQQKCAAVPMSGEPGRALGGLTRAEAEAFCAFRGGRLPTADEWTLAAGGGKSRRYPWGDTGAVCRRGTWGLQQGPCGFGFAGPELAGAHPDGATPDGVHDLAGNVAEWVGNGPDGHTEWARDERRGPGERRAESHEGGMGLVRGGSFATSLATNLRTWHAHTVPASTRSAEIGARCVYDLGSKVYGASSSPSP